MLSAIIGSACGTHRSARGTQSPPAALQKNKSPTSNSRGFRKSGSSNQLCDALSLSPGGKPAPGVGKERIRKIDRRHQGNPIRSLGGVNWALLAGRDEVGFQIGQELVAAELVFTFQAAECELGPDDFGSLAGSEWRSVVTQRVASDRISEEIL